MGVDFVSLIPVAILGIECLVYHSLLSLSPSDLRRRVVSLVCFTIYNS